MKQKRILALFQLPARKYSPLPLNAQGGPTGWLAKKNHPRCAPVFFSAKPCAIKGKGQKGRQEIEILAPRSRLCLTQKTNAMIEVKEMKIHEVQAMNPKTPVIDTLTYRERNYPVREISDGRDTYKVSVERLNFDLLDGIRGLDPTAFDIDESICYFCTEDEIRTLTDEQLIELIYG